ncbi:uncharacterized protein CDV56_102391 [Aspergillus thermomutatus]|uniref:Uncharacterized protein n=1 Tax=Aspergillus thermomutatus TaxID=41047 RepID=A0A397GUE1_ASPTH|nr:uncharacterized protein CDV56_102391 [Aspergillus thermomutatus]RHZ53909.1 hypothetical protein CDV56_102391 [Aspergillus thermomutatus]
MYLPEVDQSSRYAADRANGPSKRAGYNASVPVAASWLPVAELSPEQMKRERQALRRNMLRAHSESTLGWHGCASWCGENHCWGVAG